MLYFGKSNNPLANRRCYYRKRKGPLVWNHYERKSHVENRWTDKRSNCNKTSTCSSICRARKKEEKNETIEEIRSNNLHTMRAMCTEINHETDIALQSTSAAHGASKLIFLKMPRMCRLSTWTRKQRQNIPQHVQYSDSEDEKQLTPFVSRLFRTYNSSKRGIIAQIWL